MTYRLGPRDRPERWWRGMVRLFRRRPELADFPSIGAAIHRAVVENA